MKHIAIIGFGGRGYIYAKLCKQRKDECKVVAVIDNSLDKLKLAKDTMGLDDNHIFTNIDDFLNAPKEAEWLFVCTQDKDHREHAVKALNKGYDILLEKPVASKIEDCIEIEKVAKQNGRKVDVCHVLRYSKYYEKIKEIMDSGVLGQIVAIDQVENVAYWHQAHSFVRGDWANKGKSAPMILAKCCHDLDIAVYLANSKCKQVVSQGQLNFFKKGNAPEGATQYCLDGCKAKENCPYDCEKIYVDPIKDADPDSYKEQWPQSRLMPDGIVTLPKVYDALKTTNFGKCVFLCDNDVVDYQVTTMLFENGINSTLTMTAFSGPTYRETRIRGTMGDLVCDMGKNSITLYEFGKEPREIDLNTDLDWHGGGDERLIDSFADDKLRTDISTSNESHFIAFAAEESRLNNATPVVMKDFKARYNY